MKLRKASKLNRMVPKHLRERGMKKKVAEEEIKPRSLMAAEKTARRLNIPVEEVISGDLQHMLESDYPGPECLEPHEVEEFIATGEFQDETLLSHLDICVSCEALILAAKPRKEGLQALLEDLRYDLSQVEANISRESQQEESYEKAFIAASLMC
jgi:hypothetical protein